MIRILRKEGEKVELLRCEGLFLTVHEYTARGLVNLKSTYLNHVILRHCASDKPLISCKMSLDTRHKLTWAERLGHIVVGTKS